MNTESSRWLCLNLGVLLELQTTTVRNYLDRLTSAMVIRQLQPWYENISKRQVKAPKVFIADSGLLHTLLTLKTQTDLEVHPKLGASWEGFVLEQVIRHLGLLPEECFFWATHSGAELDFLVTRGQKRPGFEVKRSVTPQMSPSIRNAVADLKLNRLDVIHMGEHTFSLSKKVRAVSFLKFLTDLEPLK